MPLHLIKLCVGAESIDDLEAWIAARLADMRRAGETPEHRHTTRMVPKRIDELVDGGSLFWVIRGQIAARQALLGGAALHRHRRGRSMPSGHGPRCCPGAAATVPPVPGVALSAARRGARGSPTTGTQRGNTAGAAAARTGRTRPPLRSASASSRTPVFEAFANSRLTARRERAYNTPIDGGAAGTEAAGAAVFCFFVVWLVVRLWRRGVEYCRVAGIGGFAASGVWSWCRGSGGARCCLTLLSEERETWAALLLRVWRLSWTGVGPRETLTVMFFQTTIRNCWRREMIGADEDDVIWDSSRALGFGLGVGLKTVTSRASESHST